MESLANQRALRLLDLGSAIIAHVAEVGKCHRDLRGICKELQTACDAARQSLLIECPCQAYLEALAKWPSLTRIRAGFCQNCEALSYSSQLDSTGHAETAALLKALSSRRLVSLKLQGILGVDQRALVNLLQACQGSLRVLELGGSTIVSGDESNGTNLIRVLQGLKLAGMDLSGFYVCPDLARTRSGDWTPVFSEDLCRHLRSLEIHVSENVPQSSSFWSELGLRLLNLQKLRVTVPFTVKRRFICELARGCEQLRELVVVLGVVLEDDPIADSLFSVAPELPHLERLEVEDLLLPATLTSFASRCRGIKRLRFALQHAPEQFELFRLGCSQLHSLETLGLLLDAWGTVDDAGGGVRESDKRILMDGILAIPNLKSLELIMCHLPWVSSSMAASGP